MQNAEQGTTIILPLQRKKLHNMKLEAEKKEGYPCQARKTPRRIFPEMNNG